MQQSEIVEVLRKRITGGEFPPGATLPHRQKLLEEYGISVATFQKCINRLIREGFLISRGTRGTVVPEYPPHLYHYALVFPEEREKTETIDTFFPALRDAGKTFSLRNSGTCMQYYFVGNTENHAGGEMEQLIADARNTRLAGIIFVNFVPSPDIQRQLIPCSCVVISRLSSDSYHNYPSLEFDSESLLSQCLQVLHEQGRKRIAVLVHQNLSTQRLIRMQKLLDPVHPEWLLGIDHLHGRPLLHKNVLKLLFSLPQRKRPEALAVLNENFMPLVQEVLLESGLEPGRDVSLTAHCNFPVTTELYSNTEYFAYSALEVIENAIKLLKQSGNGSIKLIQPKPLSILLKQ